MYDMYYETQIRQKERRARLAKILQAVIDEVRVQEVEDDGIVTRAVKIIEEEFKKGGNA